MPVAPASFSAGMSVLMSFLATTASTAYPSSPNSFETVGDFSAGQQVDHRREVRLVDVELHEHAAPRFERAGEQRLELLHRLALVGVGVRDRVGDQLGVRDEHRVEHLEAGRPERPAALGDLDHRVGDLGDLGLGRAVRQRDVGVDAVLLEEPPRELGVLGLHAHAGRAGPSPTATASRRRPRARCGSAAPWPSSSAAR